MQRTDTETRIQLSSDPEREMTTVESHAYTEAKPSLDDQFASIKQKQRSTWASGDFSVIGTTLQIVGEELAEAADARAREPGRDLAAATGNATIAAARRFAAVTSRDSVP